MRPVVGPYRASRFLLNVAKRTRGEPRAVVLNGQAASLFVDDGDVVTALVLDIMDGSIVPLSMGANPLATISALAERACEKMADDNGWTIKLT